MLISALDTHLSLLINHVQYGSVQMPWEKRSCEAVSCQQGGSSETPWAIWEAVTDGEMLRKQKGVWSMWFLLPTGSRGSVRSAKAAPASWEVGCGASPSRPAHASPREPPNRGKRGCPNTVWTPGNLFRRVLPLLSISSLTGKKTLHRKVSPCTTQVSKSD